MKILDCTLRDGGYYTNWDFDSNLVKSYFESINQLPIEYIEIGYRSKPISNYLGEFFYCPEYVLENVRKNCIKKIAIMLNEKDVILSDLNRLLNPCIGLIDMIRIAVDPLNFGRGLILAENIKNMGFEVGFNLMYMSTWVNHEGLLDQFTELDGKVDYFSMVDSYGSVYPEDVRRILEIVKSKTNVKLGFHGHNNLELGLINSLTAIDSGVDMVDSTITGMGRGAGNLKTELLLTALNARGKLNINLNFNALSFIVEEFFELQKKYEWGTNLPYMVSGANSLPQKDVMEWVGKRYYSFNSIIRALSNMSNDILDNKKLPIIDFSDEIKCNKALIIGGGSSVINHISAIRSLINLNPEMIVIHASSKNAVQFNEIPNKQYFCLVGNEGHRLEKSFKFLKLAHSKFILPPFPRIMGTYVPSMISENIFELSTVDFTEKFQDSHTALALQTAKSIGVTNIYLAGYDGYAGDLIGEKEQDLIFENEYLFNALNKCDIRTVSITPTKYKILELQSVYSLI
jgi:4-hydroxy 2-oxovalerate aldolase